MVLGNGQEREMKGATGDERSPTDVEMEENEVEFLVGKIMDHQRATDGPLSTWWHWVEYPDSVNTWEPLHCPSYHQAQIHVHNRILRCNNAMLRHSGSVNLFRHNKIIGSIECIFFIRVNAVSIVSQML